jgi:hypothetical protein
MDISTIKNELSKSFCIKSEFAAYETYNETWAEILNVIFLGFLSNPLSKNKISQIENLLNIEIQFSLFQCVKVLQQYDLKYSDIITSQQPNQYREDTNVFCYYILKSLTLFFTNDFIQWCSKHNGENLLNFKKTPKQLGNFCDFILGLYKDPDYLNEMNHMEQWVKQQTLGAIERDTMRMTIFG